MSEALVWDCPSCEDTNLGTTPEEAYKHLLHCGKPPWGYEGCVYLGVKRQYKSELENLKELVAS